MKILIIRNDDINDLEVQRVADFFNAMPGNESVHVLISSTGGGVDPALAIAAIIEEQAVDRNIIITCYGTLDSAATLIAFCNTRGNKKEVLMDCEFAIHQVSHTVQIKNMKKEETLSRLRETEVTNAKIARYFKSIIPGNEWDEEKWNNNETLYFSTHTLSMAIKKSINSPFYIGGLNYEIQD